jgi:hypothetical protein
MLTAAKKRLLLTSLKDYHKKYLKRINSELDESATRIMINSLLTDVLGFIPIEEVKTEYMIRGTYADYVVQVKNTRHFLVEVKALGFDLSERHLRQAIGYGASEGIEWALLTNGRQIDFYRIIFEKPIQERKVFSIDLSDIKNLKTACEMIQYMHKLSVQNNGLDLLWAKCVALHPKTVAGLLKNKPIVSFLKRTLKKRYKHKFTDEEISNSIDRIIYESIELDEVKSVTVRKRKKNTNDTAAEVQENTQNSISD